MTNTRALLELSNKVLAQAVNGKSWRYPGGEGKVLQCKGVGSIGAIWACMYPEDFDFTYLLGAQQVEVFLIAKPHGFIYQHLADHMGIDLEQFVRLYDYESTPVEIAANIRNLVKELTYD